MKIYTKLGDQGETSLIGGKRVPKHHPRIDAYGTIDELISFLAVIRDSEIDKQSAAMLLKIQHKLMDCAALLAYEDNGQGFRLPEIAEEDIEMMEKEIDAMEKSLPTLKSFIIPGGHIASSYCHVARNICRRAERKITILSKSHSVDKNLMKYVNRLSDYLFVLSRKILINNNIEEIEWKN